MTGGEFLFVSCDIVMHSAAPDETQLRRVSGLNAIVGRFLSARPGAAWWFSAGDGGHVALKGDDAASAAFALILALKEWSIGTSVPLRIAGASGPGQWFPGATGAQDMIGRGINLSAHVLQATGLAEGVVATEEFRLRTEKDLPPEWSFHSRARVQLRPGQLAQVWLLSLGPAMRSRWSVALPDTEFWRDDRARLAEALDRGDGVKVMYHAKRLLQTNRNDSDALNALRTFTGPSARRVSDSHMLAQLLADRATGLEFIRASALVERSGGDVLCRAGDEGTTMFLVLRGHLQGFLGRADIDGDAAPDFEVGPGELLGEMAFALRSTRAATLVCADDCSLLAFGQQELRATSDPDLQQRIQEAVDALVLVRVLQNTCRAATYLSGTDRSGPLGQFDRPWQDLLPHSRLVSLHWRDNEVDLTSGTFTDPGIYILVGGALATREENVIQASNPEPPILKAHLGARAVLPERSYRILDEVKILLIGAAGLEGFGPKVYAQLASAVAGRAQPARVPTAKQAVEGLLRVGGAEGPSRVLDVIFVHGLDGDARNTWRPDGDPEAFWPSWLAADVPGISVWSLGYDVSPSAWKGTAMPLVDRATHSLAKLEAQGLGDRPIVYITHSMGGLLVKQMLRHGADYGVQAWKILAAQTSGIVFLSTPHSGSDLANWMKHLGTLLRATVSIDELRAQDPRLRDLNTWFRNWITPSVAVDVYCEKLPMNGFTVVDEASADPGVQGVVVIPVDENHATICKPASRDKLIYQRVRKFVADRASTH